MIQVFFVVPKVFPQLSKKGWEWTLFFIYMGIGWGIPFLCILIPSAANRVYLQAYGTL